MIYEFNSYIHGTVVKIFLNPPFMDENNVTKIIHNHKYTEIHIVFGGNLKIFIENQTYVFSSGDTYAIPGGMYHCYSEVEPQTQIIAFQTDIALERFRQHAIPESVIEAMIRLLKQSGLSSDCSEVSALFSFVASAFFPTIPPQHSKDEAVLIYEFISKKYNQTTNVSELSQILCLSDKQTERLVKKYTGYTYKKAIMNYRLKVAKFLEENTDMNQSEISKYVGYVNYSGFWKAKNFYHRKQHPLKPSLMEHRKKRMVLSE